jgi:hypothetical protein
LRTGDREFEGGKISEGGTPSIVALRRQNGDVFEDSISEAKFARE